MKGIRFYEEFRNKRSQNAGNCIALFMANEHGTDFGLCCEGLAPVFPTANSPVQVVGVSLAFVRESCTRVSEARAREIHPQLFARLDADEPVSND